MNVAIAPTVTAEEPHAFREQMERAMSVASRIHVDYADGRFAPSTMVQPVQSWLPEGYRTDLHVMYEHPEREIEQLIALRPNLIILHAEANGNILGLLREINGAGIQSGIALLQNTQPEDYANEVEEAEHVLLFGGHLGYHGGEADLTLLDKIPRIQEINPLVEIGWDGGANAENAAALVQAGVRVLNVGSFIQKSDDPRAAYAILESVVN